jgi:glycerate 2-kinase
MNPGSFWTTSFRDTPWGERITRILAAALDAVDPAAAVRRFLHRDGNLLHAGEQVYDLAKYERVFLVGVGKAGTPMARAAAEVLGDRITGGVVVVKEGHSDSSTGHPVSGRPWSVIESAHPIPDARSVEGAQRVADLLAQTTERDLVVAVISGGGSALLTLPAPGLTLAGLQALTGALLRCGANINEASSASRI